MAKILVIDDDELVRETLSMVLEDSGHSTESAQHGRIGLKLLAQTNFDLVITDLFMPEMEGFETIREIRKKQPELKIIVISGGGRGIHQDVFLEDAELMGANASLAKPFKNSELIALINDLLD